jgi:mRNA interferase RelE/StbE
MDLVIEKAASKVLVRIPPKLAASMTRKLEAIAADPAANHPNVKPLVGRKDAYRLRQGDWRIVYFVDRVTQRMHVLAIDTRGDVYK